MLLSNIWLHVKAHPRRCKSLSLLEDNSWGLAIVFVSRPLDNKNIISSTNNVLESGSSNELFKWVRAFSVTSELLVKSFPERLCLSYENKVCCSKLLVNSAYLTLLHVRGRHDCLWLGMIVWTKSWKSNQFGIKSRSNITKKR